MAPIPLNARKLIAMQAWRVPEEMWENPKYYHGSSEFACRQGMTTEQCFRLRDYVKIPLDPRSNKFKDAVAKSSDAYTLDVIMVKAFPVFLLGGYRTTTGIRWGAIREIFDEALQPSSRRRMAAAIRTRIVENPHTTVGRRRMEKAMREAAASNAINFGHLKNRKNRKT
jgi:hypothetical protein